MATAKMHNGVAIVAYVNGKAVDSEGKEIEGAPKAPKDTDPSEQPGALGAPTAEERMGRAIAQAIVDPKGTLATKKPATAKSDKADASDDERQQPDKTASQRAGEAAVNESANGESASTAAAKSAGSEELPKMADLRDRLAGLTTAEDVRAMQKRDDRKKAAPMYKARLAELKGQ